MMQLTEHFSLEELTRSLTAERLGIDNVPKEERLLTNLMLLAGGLERVRELLGGLPLHVDSGYRCEELNQKIGGSKNSAHMSGYAADFICPSFGTPLEIVKRLEKSELAFDQLIQEGTWVHVSFAPRMRREVPTPPSHSQAWCSRPVR